MDGQRVKNAALSPGPLVMAVNSTPELEAIESASGVDVAGKIYKFLEDSVAPRDVREQIEV